MSITVLEYLVLQLSTWHVNHCATACKAMMKLGIQFVFCLQNFMDPFMNPEVTKAYRVAAKKAINNKVEWHLEWQSGMQKIYIIHWLDKFPCY